MKAVTHVKGKRIPQSLPDESHSFEIARSRNPSRIRRDHTLSCFSLCL